MKKTLPLILTSLSLLLASCGGGGSSSATTPTTPSTGTTSTNTDTTTTPSTGTTPTTPTTGTGTTPSTETGTTPSTGAGTTPTTPSTGTGTTPSNPGTGTTPSTPAADFSFSLSPNALTVAQGASGSVTASLTPSNGFKDAVTYSVAGLPAGMTSSINGSVIILNNTSANSGSYTLSVTATSGKLTHTAPLSVTVPVTVKTNNATVLNPAGVQSVDPANPNQMKVTYSVVGDNLYNLDTYMQFMPDETNGTRILSSKKLANGQTELDLTLYFNPTIGTKPLPFKLVVTYKDKTTQLLPVTIQYVNTGGATTSLDPSAQRGPTAQEQAALNRLNTIRASGVCNGVSYGSQPALNTNPLLNVANQDLVIQSAKNLYKTPSADAMRFSSLLAGYTDPSYLFDYIQLGVGYNTPTFPDNRPYTDGAAFIDWLASKGECQNLMRPFPNSVAAVSFGQSGTQIANHVGGLWSLVVESTVR